MWTSNISSMVFTRVKVNGTSALNKKYPDIYFTSSDRAQTEARFPTVLIREIGSVERGQDLDGTEVNAVLCTFQVDVTDSQSQQRVRDVMDVVAAAMKGMRFSIVEMPEFQNTDATFRSTARFRRMIGQGDVL